MSMKIALLVKYWWKCQGIKYGGKCKICPVVYLICAQLAPCGIIMNSEIYEVYQKNN
jgi:hypothetical protein